MATAGEETDTHASALVRTRYAPRLRDTRTRWKRLADWIAGRPAPATPLPNVPLVVPDSERVGICCSGGGVRSAAYNLGALQVLREAGVLEGAKYLSAVSGGAYIAAAHAALASRSPARDGEPPLYAPGSPEEQYLRNRSNYLAPGAGGKARLLLRILLGMAVNLLLVGIAVTLLALPLGWLAGAVYGQLGDPHASGPLELARWMWIAPLVPAALGVLAALPDLVRRLGDDAARRALEAWSARLIGTAVWVAVALIAVPQVLLWARGAPHVSFGPVTSTVASDSTAAGHGTTLFGLVNVTAVVTAVLGALRAFVARRRSWFVLAAAAIAGPLAVIAPALLLLNASAAAGVTSGALIALGACAVAGVAMWLAADLTQWSLHPFYRRRLSSAFFVERSDDPDVPPSAHGRGVKEMPYERPLWLHDVHPAASTFPHLIVCAAANVSDGGDTPPGRWATPFTFTVDDVGGPMLGVLPTRDFEDAANRSITLPAAVAMSGAAVSPAMGKKTIRALSFLLGLTNVRLGVWVPNPRRVHEPGDGAHGRPRPQYLLKELLGRTSVNDRFLYVTDGGHYDNLGLIELLRRGCTTIYCLDAGGDRGGTYRALGEAVALARSELQVDIVIDPTPIEPAPKTRISAQDHVIGRFRFRAESIEAPGGTPAESAAAWIGRLVYCRAAVTEEAPWDVRAFHDRDKRFPYHSTFDQLFNDEKFESYRALGAHTTRRAVDSLRAKRRDEEIERQAHEAEQLAREAERLAEEAERAKALAKAESEGVA